MKSALIISLLLILLNGCSRDNNYESFVDTENKGKTHFLKHRKSCKTYIDRQMKPNEGSEGAGELSRRKQQLFLLCMEKKGWRSTHES